MDPFSSVRGLVRSLRSIDDDLGDDDVPVLAHLLQTADLLAARHPADDELIVAGLVHDLAVALNPGSVDHAGAGAELIAPLLGLRVATLVGGHVEAKRYLVTMDPAYAVTLSQDSTATLVLQGGPMTHAERDRFAARSDRESLLALRRADDAAKLPGRRVATVTSWIPLLDGVARAAKR